MTCYSNHNICIALFLASWHFANCSIYMYSTNSIKPDSWNLLLDKVHNDTISIVKRGLYKMFIYTNVTSKTLTKWKASYQWYGIQRPKHIGQVTYIYKIYFLFCHIDRCLFSLSEIDITDLDGFIKYCLYQLLWKITLITYGSQANVAFGIFVFSRKICDKGIALKSIFIWWQNAHFWNGYKRKCQFCLLYCPSLKVIHINKSNY